MTLFLTLVLLGQAEPAPEAGSPDVGEVFLKAGDMAWTGTQTVGRDAAYLATFPLRMDGDEALFTAGAFAALGAAFALDEPVQRAFGRNPSRKVHHFLDCFEPAGNNLAIPGGVLALGLLTDEKWVVEMGLTAIEATVFASLATEGLKVAVGRKRPNSCDDAFRFHAFGGDTSFPSGHVTNVAPMVAVFSLYLDSWIFDVIGYTFVGLKAAQRVEANDHWFSDTVGSTVLGAAIGATLVELRRNPELKILPWTTEEVSGEGGIGLQTVLEW